LRASIVLQADNRRKAEAIAGALDPDNAQVPRGMKISTKSKGSLVVTEIRFSGRIQTMLLAIDDLLKCAQTAELALKSISCA